jgi:TRAP-type C4-dicarboxylate transport system substrate-binding protein
MGVATYSSWQLSDVMPYMVNGSLFYGNIIYMMSENAYERLTPEQQTIVMEAAAETEAWLQPRYEAWVDQRVGNAVMAGGGAGVSLSLEERAALLESVQETWNAEVAAACGPELAGQILELFAENAP